MKYRCAIAAICLTCLAPVSFAREHRVEVLNEPAPADSLSEEIAAALQPTGVRIISGTSREVCDIWLAKNVDVKADFEPSFTLLYPFSQGQFVGVIRYLRDGADFRDQEIEEGVYTLRYMLQPVDGNHVGTSPTRDFLLLLPAKHDKTTAVVEYDKAVEHSTEASGATHPALLSLQKPPAEAVEAPVMKEDPRDWWILHTSAMSADNKVPLALVVVGVATE